jgi:hypothetical protein
VGKSKFKPAYETRHDHKEQTEQESDKRIVRLHFGWQKTGSLFIRLDLENTEYLQHNTVMSVFFFLFFLYEIYKLLLDVASILFAQIVVEQVDWNKRKQNAREEHERRECEERGLELTAQVLSASLT